MPDPGEPTGFPDLLNPSTRTTGPDGPADPAAGPGNNGRPALSGRLHLRPRLDAELAGLRTELQRVDGKAGTLLALAGVLLGLGGGLAVTTGADRLPAPVLLLAGAAALLLVIAVVLLGAAIRPRLDGDHGFVRWARLSGHDVLDDLDTATPLAGRAGELVWTSRALLGKYTLIRRAVTLIVAGLVLIGVASGVAVACSLAGAA